MRRRTGHAAAREMKAIAKIALETSKDYPPELRAVYLEAIGAIYARPFPYRGVPKFRWLKPT